jgi:hypothetical protein
LSCVTNDESFRQGQCVLIVATVADHIIHHLATNCQTHSPFWEYIQFSWIKLQRRLVDLNPILEIHNPSYIAYVQGYTISVERKNNLHFMSTLIIIGVLDDIFDRLYNSLLNLKYLYIRQWSQCT